MPKHKSPYAKLKKLRGIGTLLVRDTLTNDDALNFVLPVLDEVLERFAHRVVNLLKVTNNVENILAYRERQLSGSLGGAFEDYGAAVIPEWPCKRKRSTRGVIS